MYVKVELKRYRNLKSTGRVVMNVRFVAYYQLMQVRQIGTSIQNSKEVIYPATYLPMQRDLNNILETASFSSNFETAGYMQGTIFAGNSIYSIPNSPTFVNQDPFAQLEFEICAKCPQNLIIYDQTDVKHQVMYNPAFFQKFSTETLPNLEVEDPSRFCNPTPFKEDTNEIDILLSSDESENFDDDTVSTGRTPYNWYSTSSNSSCCDSTCGEPDWNECNREKIMKMVHIMREIVPGMEGLDAGTVLDESVKYLKYLKTEVEMLGISSFDCGIP